MLACFQKHLERVGVIDHVEGTKFNQHGDVATGGGPYSMDGKLDIDHGAATDAFRVLTGAVEKFTVDGNGLVRITPTDGLNDTLAFNIDQEVTGSFFRNMQCARISSIGTSAFSSTKCLQLYSTAGQSNIFIDCTGAAGSVIRKIVDAFDMVELTTNGLDVRSSTTTGSQKQIYLELSGNPPKANFIKAVSGTGTAFNVDVAGNLYYSGNLLNPRGAIGEFENMLKNSESLDSSPWVTGDGGVITPNTKETPDGIPAKSDALTGSTNTAYVEQPTTLVNAANNTFTFGFWTFKDGSTGSISTLRINFRDDSGTEVSPNFNAALSGQEDKWEYNAFTYTFGAGATGKPTIRMSLGNSASRFWIWGCHLSNTDHPVGYTETRDFTTPNRRGLTINGDARLAGHIGIDEAEISDTIAINAETTFDPPALSEAPALLFNMNIDGTGFLQEPIAISGIANINRCGFGAKPIIFKAKTIVTESIDYTWSHIGFLSQANNIPSTNYVMMDVGFAASATIQNGTLGVKNKIGFACETKQAAQTSTREIEADTMSVGLLVNAQEFSRKNYGILLAGEDEDCCLAFGSGFKWTQGSTPLDSSSSARARVYYDDKDLNLQAGMDGGEGAVNILNDLAIGTNETLGSELVTNGDFATGDATGWNLTGSFSVASNELQKAHGVGTCTQTISTLVESRLYKFVYTSRNVSLGITGRDVPLISISGTTFPLRHWNTTHEFYFRAGSGNVLTISYPNISAIFELDDISIKELTSGDLYVSGVTETNGEINSINNTALIATHTALPTEKHLVCDTSGGAFTLSLLASPERGRTYTIILETAGSNLTISGNGNNINGASTVVKSTAGDVVRVIFNGTQWNLI